MTRAPGRRARGFTLIEAIMTITLTGIIAAVVAVFIRKPVEGYFDTVRRAELTDAADVAIRRIGREIALALPNSLRVMESNGVTTNHGSCSTSGYTCYVELIMTGGGGRYRDVADGSSSGNFLNFASTSATSFDVLGTMPANPAIAVGDYIVVYNLGPGYAPADAYQRDTANCDATPASPGCNIARVSGVAANVVSLDANPFAYQSPPLPSPNARFQVIPGGTRAVTYACPLGGAGNLTRHANYGFSATQAVPGGGAILATQANCVIRYDTDATGRNGLLLISLTLTDASGESVTLSGQIHVDNSP